MERLLPLTAQVSSQIVKTVYVTTSYTSKITIFISVEH